MMEHTLWTPHDTCGCSVNLIWDSSVPAEKRVHAYGSPDVLLQLRPDLWERYGGTVRAKQTGWVYTENICNDHKAMNLTGPDLLRTLFQENRMKEYIKGFVVPQVNPSIKPTDFVHSYGHDRVLHLSFPGTADEKARVQSLSDILYGKGKTVIG